MQIQEVITTINQMQTDGIIQRYAIGGAVGATFYLEPVATRFQAILTRHGLGAAWRKFEQQFLAP